MPQKIVVKREASDRLMFIYEHDCLTAEVLSTPEVDYVVRLGHKIAGPWPKVGQELHWFFDEGGGELFKEICDNPVGVFEPGGRHPIFKSFWYAGQHIRDWQKDVQEIKVTRTSGSSLHFQSGSRHLFAELLYVSEQRVECAVLADNLISGDWPVIGESVTWVFKREPGDRDRFAMLISRPVELLCVDNDTEGYCLAGWAPHLEGHDGTQYITVNRLPGNVTMRFLCNERALAVDMLPHPDGVRAYVDFGGKVVLGPFPQANETFTWCFSGPEDYFDELIEHPVEFFCNKENYPKLKGFDVILPQYPEENHKQHVLREWSRVLDGHGPGGGPQHHAQMAALRTAIVRAALNGAPFRTDTMITMDIMKSLGHWLALHYPDDAEVVKTLELMSELSDIYS